MNLHSFIFWGIAGITGFISILLSISIIKFQRKLAHKAVEPGEFHDNTVLSVIWTLVPVGLLVILLALTFQAIKF